MLVCHLEVFHNQPHKLNSLYQKQELISMMLKSSMDTTWQSVWNLLTTSQLVQMTHTIAEIQEQNILWLEWHPANGKWILLQTIIIGWLKVDLLAIQMVTAMGRPAESHSTLVTQIYSRRLAVDKLVTGVQTKSVALSHLIMAHLTAQILLTYTDASVLEVATNKVLHLTAADAPIGIKKV